MYPELRKLYFLNKYSIIAPSRSKRPDDFKRLDKKPANHDHCAFCPNNLKDDLLIQKYGEKGGWRLAVLHNKYPAVSPQFPYAYGHQEVIIESPQHNIKFSELSLDHIEQYLQTMAERLKSLSSDKKISYILQFKNSGDRAGASIKHPHSQIFASSFFPAEVALELKLAKRYKLENGTCPYCDILNQEMSGPRAIYNDPHIGAFAPFASEFHYEAWIFTKRHLDNISLLSAQEIKSLAVCLQKIIHKLDVSRIDYNFFMHQAIKEKDQHFYLKVQPRDADWAGIELGSGLIINTVAPEEAASFYIK
jgi:UDPglucose--hexose-1-phosphate uridylyltransferase